MGLFGRKRKDLAHGGLPGSAVIRAAERAEFWKKVDSPEEPVLADLGIGNLKYHLDLEVCLDDGRAPYTATGKFNVPVTIGEVEVGQTLPVRADPDDPSQVEIDWDAYRAGPEQSEVRDGFDTEEQARAHAAFPAESRRMMVDGWVSATQSGAMSREAFDESIDGMLKSGVLTAAEADAARASLGGGTT